VLLLCGCDRQTILETVSIFALLINSALIAFTGEFARDYTWTTRAWIFFTTAAGIFMYDNSHHLM
jgi:hypothetical protein